VIAVNGTPTANQLTAGQLALNSILREEDAKMHALRPVWGIAHASIPLVANQASYTVNEGLSDEIASYVTGTDGVPYRCILAHTASALTRPTSGANWRLYWERDTQAGSTWVSGTAYTSGELLRYSYRRPLRDFSAATDDPDLPPEWTRYLVYRLAYDLAPEYTIPHESREQFRRDYLEAYETILPNSRQEQTTLHYKAVYF
jgi:hypothetical protein